MYKRQAQARDFGQDRGGPRGHGPGQGQGPGYGHREPPGYGHRAPPGYGAPRHQGYNPAYRGGPPPQYRYVPPPPPRYAPPPVVHYGYPGARPWFHAGRPMPRGYRQQYYVVDEWRRYPRLSPPPRGYHWVRVGADYALVAIATGIIASIILD